MENLESVSGNQENIPVRTENESRRPKERARLIEKVDLKIKAIKEMKNFVNENIFLSPDEFREKIEKKQQEIADSLGPKFKEKYEKYQIMENELESIGSRKIEIEEEIAKKLSKKGASQEEADLGNEILADEEWEEINEKEDQIHNEIVKLRDDDIAFIMRLDSFINSVINKRKETYQAQTDFDEKRTVFWEKFFLATRTDSRELDTEKAEVIFSGHAVNIILEPSQFKKIRPNVGGTHYPSTVYNLIMGQENVQATIDHENSHNLSESFGGEVVYKEEMLKILSKKIDNFNKLRKMRAPKKVIENEMRLLNQFLDNYVNQNFDELIADTGRPFSENARSYTAYFLDSIDAAGELIKKINNPKIRENLKSAQISAENKFAEQLNRLADIYFVSENFSDAASINAAILLFGPEGLKKAERYLKNKIGEDLYESAKAIRPLSQKANYFSHIKKEYHSRKMEGRFIFLNERLQRPSDRIIEKISDSQGIAWLFNFHDVSRLVSRLRNLELSGRKEELKKISGLIDSEIISRLDFLPWEEIVNSIKDPKELLILGQKIKEFFQLLGIHGMEPAVVESLLKYYFEYKCYEAVKSNDFSLLQSLWNIWPEKRKKIAELLLERIENGILLSDYEEATGTGYNEKAIKQTGYWKFLAGIGLGEKAESVLKNSGIKD
jgi:hypothetical protein